MIDSKRILLRLQYNTKV